MLRKVLTIGDKQVAFKSSAAIPRMYRIKFGRDIFKDLGKLQTAYSDNAEHPEESNLEVADLEIFENVAYIMALHADPSIPDTIDEWLEEFEMFSIYEILPEILELWGSNLVSDAKAKKNAPPRKGK